MTPAYRLRPAEARDLPRLLEVHEGAFRELTTTRFEWDPELQRQIVSESLPSSQVVELEGRVIGQLMLEDRGAELFLARVMLEPSWQGQGLGRRLVEGVIASATSRGGYVTLSVWENNRARSLYERLGFRVTSQEGFRVKMRLDPL